MPQIEPQITSYTKSQKQWLILKEKENQQMSTLRWPDVGIIKQEF